MRSRIRLYNSRSIKTEYAPSTILRSLRELRMVPLPRSALRAPQGRIGALSKGPSPASRGRDKLAQQREREQGGVMKKHADRREVLRNIGAASAVAGLASGFPVKALAQSKSGEL